MLHEITSWIKGVYGTPSSETLALRELEESKRKLLEVQSAKEYAESMCRYYEVKIKRLTTYIHKSTEE
jgi:hypothetical protein